MSNTSVTIFNLFGEEVYSEAVNGKQVIVSTKLISGIYFVKVDDNESEYVHKIIVE